MRRLLTKASSQPSAPLSYPQKPNFGGEDWRYWLDALDDREVSELTPQNIEMHVARAMEKVAQLTDSLLPLIAIAKDVKQYGGVASMIQQKLKELESMV